MDPASNESSAPRHNSQGSMPAVRSATRGQPLPPDPVRGPLKDRLREGSLDVVLNTASVLREVAEDFRNRDRHFKWKAGIIAAWVLLSMTSLGVACGSPAGQLDSDLGAEWVLAGDAARPVFSIYNHGDEAWEDVVVVINGRYRATQGLVAPGGNITLTPRQLLGDDGATAPSDLVATDVELRTREGKERLLEGGRAR